MSVYLIRPTICYEAGDWYIGSTKQALNSRMRKHRDWFHIWKNGGKKTLSSSVLFEKYGVDNCEIVALETNISIEELLWRERHYLENYRTINRVKRPIRMKDEKKLYDAEYRKKNKERLYQAKKDKYHANKNNTI